MLAIQILMLPDLTAVRQRIPKYPLPVSVSAFRRRG